MNPVLVLCCPSSHPSLFRLVLCSASVSVWEEGIPSSAKFRLYDTDYWKVRKETGTRGPSIPKGIALVQL